MAEMDDRHNTLRGEEGTNGGDKKDGTGTDTGRSSKAICWASSSLASTSSTPDSDSGRVEDTQRTHASHTIPTHAHPQLSSSAPPPPPPPPVVVPIGGEFGSISTHSIANPNNDTPTQTPPEAPAQTAHTTTTTTTTTTSNTVEQQTQPTTNTDTNTLPQTQPQQQPPAHPPPPSPTSDPPPRPTLLPPSAFVHYGATTPPAAAKKKYDRLTDEQHGKIIDLHLKHMSSVDIARALSINPKSIYTFIARYKQTGQIWKKTKGGNQRKDTISPNEIEFLCSAQRANPSFTIVQLQRHMADNNFPSRSLQAISNVLKRNECATPQQRLKGDKKRARELEIIPKATIKATRTEQATDVHTTTNPTPPVKAPHELLTDLDADQHVAHQFSDVSTDVDVDGAAVPNVHRDVDVEVDADPDAKLPPYLQPPPPTQPHLHRDEHAFHTLQPHLLIHADHAHLHHQSHHAHTLQPQHPLSPHPPSALQHALVDTDSAHLDYDHHPDSPHHHPASAAAFFHVDPPSHGAPLHSHVDSHSHSHSHSPLIMLRVDSVVVGLDDSHPDDAMRLHHHHHAHLEALETILPPEALLRMSTVDSESHS